MTSFSQHESKNWIFFSGNTEQPADDTGESSAAQPVNESDCYNLAFYNIGSDVTTHREFQIQHHNVDSEPADDQAREVCNLIYDKCIDSITMCCPFDATDDRLQQLRGIMEKVAWNLNSSAGQPVNLVDDRAEQPAWKSHMVGHYVCIWNTHRLILTDYRYMQRHASRMSHYLQFQQTQRPSGPPLHFYHHCTDTVWRTPPVVVSVCPA